MASRRKRISTPRKVAAPKPRRVSFSSRNEISRTLMTQSMRKAPRFHPTKIGSMKFKPQPVASPAGLPPKKRRKGMA